MRIILILLTVLFLIGCAQSTTAPTPTALTITTTTLPQAVGGEIYAQQLAATGGVTPYSWFLVSGSLPSGLTLNPSGAITGIPIAPGAFSFTIQVVDSNSAAAQIQIREGTDETSQMVVHVDVSRIVAAGGGSTRQSDRDADLNG